MRALRMIKRVQAGGMIQLESLPLPEGESVEVLVLPLEDRLEDVARLNESGLGFWDNDTDDRVWNDVLPPA